MDIGDIIYYIALAIFLIFGFFNKSKRESEKRKAELPKKSMPDLEPMSNDRPVFQPKQYSPLPIPKVIVKKESTSVTIPKKQEIPLPKKKGFQSSVDLVTNFEGQSSIKGSLFVSEDDTFTKDDESDVRLEAKHSEMSGIDKSDWRKAVIFHEILTRKFQ